MSFHDPTQLENLRSEVTAALDAFYQIVSLQELLEISLELVTTRPEKRQSRTELLTICYLHQVKPFLEELETELKEIRQLLDVTLSCQKTT